MSWRGCVPSLEGALDRALREPELHRMDQPAGGAAGDTVDGKEVLQAADGLAVIEGRRARLMHVAVVGVDAAKPGEPLFFGDVLDVLVPDLISGVALVLVALVGHGRDQQDVAAIPAAVDAE